MQSLFKDIGTIHQHGCVAAPRLNGVVDHKR